MEFWQFAAEREGCHADSDDPFLPYDPTQRPRPARAGGRAGPPLARPPATHTLEFEPLSRLRPPVSASASIPATGGQSAAGAHRTDSRTILVNGRDKPAASRPRGDRPFRGPGARLRRAERDCAGRALRAVRRLDEAVLSTPWVRRASGQRGLCWSRCTEKRGVARSSSKYSNESRPIQRATST